MTRVRPWKPTQRPPTTSSKGLHHRLIRLAAWLGGVAALLVVLELLGVPVLDWIDDLFDKVAAVPAWAIAAGGC